MRRFLTALVVAALLGACGSDDSSDSAATTESSTPKPVFDYATDSLCDWFTPDDMNEILAVAQQRAGTAYDFKADVPGCRVGADPGAYQLMSVDVVVAGVLVPGARENVARRFVEHLIHVKPDGRVEYGTDDFCNW